MDDATYRAEILAAYEGELGGEVSSAVLMRHLATDGPRAVKLDLLRRLEARVGAALEPIVARLGMAPADRAGLAARARDRALTICSWEDLIAQFGPRLDDYVARFEALHAAARVGDEAPLALLVAHERALIEFGRLESAGDGSRGAGLPARGGRLARSHLRGSGRSPPAFLNQQSSVAVRSHSLRWLLKLFHSCIFSFR